MLARPLGDAGPLQLGSDGKPSFARAPAPASVSPAVRVVALLVGIGAPESWYHPPASGPGDQVAATFARLVPRIEDDMFGRLKELNAVLIEHDPEFVLPFADQLIDVIDALRRDLRGDTLAAAELRHHLFLMSTLILQSGIYQPRLDEARALTLLARVHSSHPGNDEGWTEGLRKRAQIWSMEEQSFISNTLLRIFHRSARVAAEDQRQKSSVLWSLGWDAISFNRRALRLALRLVAVEPQGAAIMLGGLARNHAMCIETMMSAVMTFQSEKAIALFLLGDQSGDPVLKRELSWAESLDEARSPADVARFIAAGAQFDGLN